jgi:hypothetical protein
MTNMGPESSEWLASVRIHTLDDMAKLDVVETYKLVKAAYPEKVMLNMLWGLQAALLDLSWNDLPSDIQEELKSQVEARS